jgi:hypothetical protein
VSDRTLISEYWDDPRLAREFDVKESTIERWRRLRIGPPYIRRAWLRAGGM